MNSLTLAVAETLTDIESELRTIGLWQIDLLSPETLLSDQPFALDKLTFVQWLQFIFLPKMHLLIEQKSSFPSKCAIAPMAEHYFASKELSSASLIAHLEKLDHLLSAHQ